MHNTDSRLITTAERDSTLIQFPLETSFRITTETDVLQQQNDMFFSPSHSTPSILSNNFFFQAGKCLRESGHGANIDFNVRF